MATNIHPYYFSLQKRVFDIALACFFIILGIPLCLFLVIVILAIHGLPVFFTQKRMGQHKKTFSIIKFRTMYKKAHRDQKKYKKENTSPEPMFKIYDDPRFIGIGKWLSKTGLDELPQLINILKGEMSFVGPRPLPLQESKSLTSSWDFRYKVKPGIFSFWAIDPRRYNSLTDWKKLEKQTLMQGSIGDDIRLIVKTISQLWGVKSRK